MKTNKLKLLTDIKNTKVDNNQKLKFVQKLNSIIEDFKNKTMLEKLTYNYNLILSKKKNNKLSKYLYDSFKEEDRSIISGDVLMRIYYLANLPNYLSPGILFKLVNLPINLTLSYYIEGTNKTSMLKAAKQRLSVLEVMQNERYKKSKIEDSAIEKEINEINSFIYDLIEEKERSFLVSIYAVLSNSGKKTLLQDHNIFQSESYDSGLIFNTYAFDQKKALLTTMPFNNDTLKKDTILQTSAVINILPFLTRNLSDPNGIFFGVNHYNHSILLFDFFKGRNANINIFGTSGSGKSFTSKLMITRFIIRGIKCIVIDPEGEYIQLGKHLGGKTIKLEQNLSLNPFMINEYFTEIVDRVDILKKFFKFFISDNKYDTSRISQKLFELYGIKKNPQIEDFINICKEETFYNELYQFQNEFIISNCNNFKGIDFESNLTIIDFSDLRSEDKKESLIYLLGIILKKYIEKDKRIKKMIFIDEAHKFLNNNILKNFFVDLIKTARKRNTGIVSITQNVEDFKLDDISKSILTQADTNILLKQAHLSVKYLIDNSIFPLTEEEEYILSALSVGEALIIQDKEHVLADIISFDKEEEIITT